MQPKSIRLPFAVTRYSLPCAKTIDETIAFEWSGRGSAVRGWSVTVELTPRGTIVPAPACRQRGNSVTSPLRVRPWLTAVRSTHGAPLCCRV